MPTKWTGYYLDGRTAARRHATVTISPDALRIALADSMVLTWPYSEVLQAQGTYVGEPVRFERMNTGEALVVSSTTILEELHRRSASKQLHIHNPARRRRRLHWTIAAGIAAVLLVIVLHRWGIPLFSSAIAASVPISWEQRIGETAVDHFASEERRCADPYRTQLIRNVLTTLTDTASNSPYEFKLYLVDSPVVNALAAPGGHIVVFRGLLEKTESAEQLAGVLAHEVQHVLKRHSMRMLTEQFLTAALLSTVSGDFSTAMTYGMQSIQMLGQLQYSQAHESEADSEGIKLFLKAGLPAQEMIAFYQIMSREHPERSRIFDYLASHPHMTDRISQLEHLAGNSPPSSKRLLSDFDWKFVRAVCRKSPRL